MLRRSLRACTQRLSDGCPPAGARYYLEPDKSGVRCYNCEGRGHMSFNCTNQRKLSPCHKCGETGHLSRACPGDLCHGCLMRGHRLVDCPLPRYDRYRPCQRCGYTGHPAFLCTDLWRQWHDVTQDGHPPRYTVVRHT